MHSGITLVGTPRRLKYLLMGLAVLMMSSPVSGAAVML
jgi:hypothetical protein